MIASGTTIDTIVRGWRSRWDSEIGATSVGSSSRASMRDDGSWWCGIGESSAGVDSIAPDPTEPALSSTP